ncbi:hypothetical protein HWV23_06585 [Natronomonas halophila]|uniref:hypothetical protein n=1 Tax=Natronomonas halophila TaxID=2747817 RepID=UPI0015B529FB|nr:hypothetical protein [Natronomonas halophila]QLD85408.1 hypothetical protein HWV23_06585 [Natronomonas halophila]
MLALQLGIPGGPELLLLGLLFLILPFVFAYYVYTDAEERGEENAALWAVVAGVVSFIASPFAGLLVVIVYIWQRDEKETGV